MKKVPLFEDKQKNIDVAAYNIWKDGPGKANAIIALNSEDIDYNDWDDVKIYIWDMERLSDK